MDKEHFVDLSVIGDFKLVKALTTDESQILQAVKNSTKVCEPKNSACSTLIHTHALCVGGAAERAMCRRQAPFQLVTCTDVGNRELQLHVILHSSIHTLVACTPLAYICMLVLLLHSMAICVSTYILTLGS